MRKKIALFIIGFVLAVGTLLLYQFFTGASFNNLRKAPPAPVNVADEDRPPTFESRRPNGDLEYLLSTQKAVPFKDAQGNLVAGEYALTEPTASYYTEDGKLIFIRADSGTITVDAQASSDKVAKKDRMPVKEGHLSGHVVLTYGARETFTDNSLVRKPGQWQVRFEKDLDLNFAEQILTSPGLVHLRSDQVLLDEENLTIAFNRDLKRVELLRLDPPPGAGKHGYMLIKDVGKGFGQLSGTDGAPNRGGNAAPAVAKGTDDASAGHGPAAAAAPPTTKPDAPADRRVTYKLSFGNEVTATVGTQKLTSDQLFVLFMSPAATGNGPDKGGSAGKTMAAPTPPAPAPAPANGPGTPAPAPPGNDLEVRWTGPMEMRPTTTGDLQLVDKKDVALEAIGTTQRPVIVTDDQEKGQENTVVAGRLWYHRAEQRVEVEPAGLASVVLTNASTANPSQGAGVVCQGVSYFRNANQVLLKGPGRIEVSQGLLGHADARATQAPANAPPLAVTWQKKLDVELGPRRTLRHAVFTGMADITDTGFHIDSDILDVLLAASADGKGAAGGGAGAAKQVLEHLLAIGNVHVKSERQPGLGIADAAKPDGINADRLEVMTALFPGQKTLEPSRLLAQGSVVAWSYDPHKEGGKDTGKLNRQTIYTPTFDLALQPKERAAVVAEGGSPDARANLHVAPKSLLASDGVIVELEGYAAQTVTATGRTLTANMEGGKDNTTIVIEGQALPDGTLQYARLTQGENTIGGEHILLDAKTKSIAIPGKGDFVFIEPGEKGKPDTPVQVTWKQKMDFDGKSMTARFFGDVDAHVTGRKDEESKLTCSKELDIQLPERPGMGGVPPAAAAASGPAGKSRLRSLRAQGNVVAEGATMDDQGKIIQGLVLKADLLTYDDGRKELSVPGPGQMAIVDHRPPKAGDSENDSRGDTTFSWAGSLDYDQSGMISFDNNVHMRHQPAKPFKLPSMGDGAKPAPGAPAANPPLLLTTDRLTATLAQGKTTGGAVANPLAMGGGQKLDSVQADGHAVMKLGDGPDADTLSGQTLTFDAVHNTAKAEAGPNQVAEIYRPGEAIVQYREIVWDLTKNENAVTATGILGSLQQ